MTKSISPAAKFLLGPVLGSIVAISGFIILPVAVAVANDDEVVCTECEELPSIQEDYDNSPEAQKQIEELSELIDSRDVQEMQDERMQAGLDTELIEGDDKPYDFDYEITEDTANQLDELEKLVASRDHVEGEASSTTRGARKSHSNKHQPRPSLPHTGN